MLFLLVLLISMTPVVSANELRKGFTRAVLEKIIENEKGRVAVPEHWTAHLTEAVLVVKFSPKFKGVSDEMAGRVKRLLSTPERALRVIGTWGGTEFKSTFSAHAVKVLRSYIATHPPLVGPNLTRIALPFQSEASYETMLLIYYSDRIVAEIDSVLGRISREGLAARLSETNGGLLKVREIFSKRPTREEFIAAKDNFEAAISATAGLRLPKKIWGLLIRYRIVVTKQGGGGLDNFFLIGAGDDALFAEIYCGSYERKMVAFSTLLGDENIGRPVFTEERLRELLRNSNQRFLREAARQYIASRHFRTTALETAVEGLLSKGFYYSAGEAEFEEAVETIVMLLQYNEEAIAQFLVSPASPLSRRVAAARSLGWLQTDGAFKNLYASYFRGVSEADPKLREAVVDAVYQCTATTAPQRRETVLKFFGALLKSETDPSVLSAVLLRLRDLCSGRVVFLPELFRLLQTATIPPEVRAKVIFIFSNAEAFSTAEKGALPFLEAKILPYLEAAVHPELRFAASFFFLEHGERRSQALSVLADLLTPESYSRLSEPSKLFLMQGLGRYAAEIPDVGGRILGCIDRTELAASDTEALLLLISFKNKEAMTALLDHFDSLAGSSKRMALQQMLVAEVSDSPLLERLFGKIVEIYQNPKIQTDPLEPILAGFSRQKAIESLASLRGNRSALRFLFSVQKDAAQNQRLASFLDELLAKM